MVQAKLSSNYSGSVSHTSEVSHKVGVIDKLV